jgi:hypothetical protein
MIVAVPADPKRSEADPSGPQRNKAGLLQVVKAVLSAFVGIRKSTAHESDAATITPVQAIVTGIIAAAILVVGMVLLVRFVIS